MQSKTTIPLLTTGGLVLLIAAWFGFKTLQHRNLLNNGHQFALTASENILASWNSDFFRQISSEELISSFDSNGIELMFANFRRVGRLESLAPERGELLNATWGPSEENLIARFYLDGEFSTGTSPVFVELVLMNNNWQLQNFYIEAPALME